MRALCLFLTVAAFALAAVPAAAGSIVYTFEQSGSVRDADSIFTVDRGLQVPGFEATLGTLTGIEVSGAAEFDVRATFVNRSTDIFDGFGAGASGGIEAQFAQFLDSFACFDDEGDGPCESAPIGVSFVPPGGTAVVEETYQLAFDRLYVAGEDFFAEDYSRILSHNLDLFSGIDFFVGNTPIGTDFDLSFDLAYVANFSIAYLYDEAQGVPEPASLGLLGLGLTALGWRRARGARRRRVLHS